MIQKIRASVVFAFLFPAAAWAAGDDAWSQVAKASSLSDDEVDRLRHEAVSGDVGSSYILAERFGGHVHFDIHEHLFYLRLAGEQGNCQALREFARWQRKVTLHEALKSPGDWTARAAQCERKERAASGAEG